MNNDLISRQATHLALIEKGQASKRYKLGETWELNGKEIREVLDALPSVQPSDEYNRGWHDGRKALREEIWEDGRDRLD